MSNPQERQDAETKIKSAQTTSYPMQLIVLLVVFALAIGIYVYFTAGDDEGPSSLEPPHQQTMVLPA